MFFISLALSLSLSLSLLNFAFRKISIFKLKLGKDVLWEMSGFFSLSVKHRKTKGLGKVERYIRYDYKED